MESKYEVRYYDANGTLIHQQEVAANDFVSAARKSRWVDNATRKEVSGKVGKAN